MSFLYFLPFVPKVDYFLCCPQLSSIITAFHSLIGSFFTFVLYYSPVILPRCSLFLHNYYLPFSHLLVLSNLLTHHSTSRSLFFFFFFLFLLPNLFTHHYLTFSHSLICFFSPVILDMAASATGGNVAQSEPDKVRHLSHLTHNYCYYFLRIE